MTIAEYEKEALSYAGGFSLIEGVLGLCGESGEVSEILKKYMFQGHDFNKEEFAKELGDVAWYLVLCTFTAGYDLETILKINIQKLKERYPDGFSKEKSIHRDDEQ